MYNRAAGQAYGTYGQAQQVTTFSTPAVDADAQARAAAAEAERRAQARLDAERERERVEAEVALRREQERLAADKLQRETAAAHADRTLRVALGAWPGLSSVRPGGDAAPVALSDIVPTTLDPGNAPPPAPLPMVTDTPASLSALVVARAALADATTARASAEKRAKVYLATTVVAVAAGVVAYAMKGRRGARQRGR